jgi:hypothetical protein
MKNITENIFEFVFLLIILFIVFFSTDVVKTMSTQIFITLIILSLAIWSSKYKKRWALRVKRTQHIKKEFYDAFTILEIKLPREINKSPKAMELIFDALHQGAGKNEKPDFKGGFWKKPFENYEKLKKFKTDRYKNGEVQKWMSLEIESREGELHFYIVTQKRYVNIISSYIYSQYPGVEVVLSEDYTNKIRPKIHGGNADLYTSWYRLDAKDYLPIKTYIDYELDSNPKEEFKIDPLTPLLESMASVGKGEHVWYQILVRATYDESWKKEGEKAIATLLTKKVKDDKGNEKEERVSALNLTPKEKSEIEMIQRNIEKSGFDCHIRIIYAAEDGYFKSENEQIVRNAMKSFNKQGFNTFKAENQNTPYPWQDTPDKKVQTNRRAGWFFLYVMRTIFYAEIDGTTSPFKELIAKIKALQNFSAVKSWFMDDFIGYFTVEEHGAAGLSRSRDSGVYYLLNTEELATVFHFPGKVLGAPNFDRINSQKSDAPNNLPI